MSAIIQPGQLYVMRRDNKTLVPFDIDKIKIAITKAYLQVEGDNASESRRIHEIVDELAANVLYSLSRYHHTGSMIMVESIQDQVELALMRKDLHQVAKSYILYREKRRLARETQKNNTTDSQKAEPEISVTVHNKKIPLNTQQLYETIATLCKDLPNVDPQAIIQDTLRNIFDGIQLSDLRKALIMSARTKIETEPSYSYAAARMLLEDHHAETFEFLQVPMANNMEEKYAAYPTVFEKFIDKAVELELLSPVLQSFDLKKLSAALKLERDNQFTYLGLQTLFDRYFLHSNDIRFELPQIFFMRIAMGLSIEEENKEDRAIEFYNLLSSFDYMSSTPTLFNSGTLRSQLSSCYISIVPDHLAGIYDALKDNALLSKFAGGLGNSWTAVRAMNARIKGTNGKSQGVVPFLKVANDSALAVNQGGKRKGALCVYLEVWHLDIEEFVELRKNTGDDRRRTHDINTANWIPDLFMKRVHENKDWTLFSPDDVPDLHEIYGHAFEEKYTYYEQLTREEKITNFKTIPAVQLWRKILGLIFETGHPWVTFKDPCNLRSPQQHVGVIHSSNLCTEITLNTSEEEIAVCNLGSINLAQHLTENGLDLVKLERTINTAIRMLDNVIDINYYSVPQARHSNLRHRPIGLGLMGFQDALYMLNIPYASQAAVEFADRSMEAISYFAIQASNKLAQERGTYESYTGSLWSQGILPIDSIELVKKTRGESPAYFSMDQSQTLNWDILREQVMKTGMRNSNVMAIAPTATISNICGVVQSIEPTYQNLYVKSNLSGEFTIVNPYLVKDLKDLNLWDEVLVNDLKYFNGSVQNIDRIPATLKIKYATAFEIDARWLIEAASRRQKWIDQAQSLNIYIAKPSGPEIDKIYKLAWKLGLKTTYYCRSLGASDTEKSTLNRSTLNAVKNNNEEPIMAKACSIDNPECEACQ